MAVISKRRWFQFSLRTLLAVITFLAVVPGGWLIYQTYSNLRGYHFEHTLDVEELKEWRSWRRSRR